MSHTVSRGLHNASRWRTPAIALLELLEGVPERPHHLGAILAIERFLTLVLIECERTQGERPEDTQAPLMAGACALSIVNQIIKETLPALKLQCQTLLGLLRRMRMAGTPEPTLAERASLRRLLEGLC